MADHDEQAGPGPAITDTEHEEPDMTAILDRHPITETVPAEDAPTGMPDDLADIDVQIRTELDFLTALIWAPDTAAAVHAIVGDHAHRAATPAPADRIPVGHLHRLFITAAHTRIFTAVIALVDQGSPITPAIIQAHLGADRAVRGDLLEIGAPSGLGPLPGGTEVPHLARAVVDAYYRRGYLGLLSAMNKAAAEAPTDDLAGHWEHLTEHQQTAQARRLAVTDELAKL